MADPATPFDEVTTAPAAPVTVADPAPVAPVVPALVVPDSVQDMIGDGKKYSSPEDALKSIPFAQEHIETLEDELASLREQAAKSKALEEVLAELKPEVSKTPSEPTPEPQVDPVALDALIDQALQNKETKAVVQANTKIVVDKFIETFGDKDNAIKEYTQRAEDLGLSIEYLNNLAGVSPKAVFELCGLKPTEGAPISRVTSNINSEAVHQPPVNTDPPKSVMGRSSSSDDINAWKAAAPS